MGKVPELGGQTPELRGKEAPVTHALSVHPKGQKIQLSDNFWSNEFDCPCTYTDCVFTYVSSWGWDVLEKLREDMGGIPVTVRSGYRCAKYQQDLRDNPNLDTSVGVSSHQKGMAFDVHIPGKLGQEMAQKARERGVKAVGTGSDFVHIDGRMDKERSWDYPY